MESDSNVLIHEVTSGKKDYLPLLLEGDEQESMIDRYLGRGRLFVMKREEKTVAVCVVTDNGAGVFEVKNIAVAEAFRRQGHGRRMLDFIARKYAPAGHTLLVGTGETPSTVSFYRHCGFTYSHRVPDFFTNNYDHPIVEDGILLKDMVYLRKALA